MKQAIALAGGGTKGAYQVGAWKAMRELGIPFDIVTGTSIGSVTAALMVQDDFDRAWELWTHITEEQIMLERDDATPHEKHELAALAEHPEQLIARVKDWADLNRRTADISPYRALVHKYLDEERFFASPVDFGLMTARFPSLQPVEVRKQDIAPGYLPQWILASSACFPMFPMCEIDGQNYLDGAYSDNLPISTAFRLGADRVIAIGLKPETPEKKYANHPLVTTSPRRSRWESCWSLTPTRCGTASRSATRTRCACSAIISAAPIRLHPTDRRCSTASRATICSGCCAGS